MITRILLLALTALTLAAPSATADPATGTGTISGCLTDTRTNLPIIDAWVAILETNQGARTDSSGCFDINDVRPGTYHLSVTHDVLGTLKGTPELTVAVSAGNTSQLTARLAPAPKADGSEKKEKPGVFERVKDFLD